jgi:LmbE family N-acetylglucosaminyl deacetylase
MEHEESQSCTAWAPRRAMIIYPHPDDIEFSVAGTAARWVGLGSEVTYVVLTDGNAGSHELEMTPERLTAIRRREQQAAARVVGAARCLFLGHQDGLLQPTLEIRKELVRLIRLYRPQVVVCGDPRALFHGDTYINHPDHRAAATVVIDAVFPAAEMELLYPDLLEEGLLGHKVNHVYISTRTDPNCFIDITETIETKIEALRQHASQLGDWDPADWVRERAAESGKQVGFRFAESFRRMTLREIENE